VVTAVAMTAVVKEVYGGGDGPICCGGIVATMGETQ
jgi:hypothetical protein